MTNNQEVLENLTVRELQTPKGQKAFNQAAGEWIRDRIHKTSLFYKVIPPQCVKCAKRLNISTSEQPDLRCYKPKVSMSVSGKKRLAMLMDMRGSPEYINGDQDLPIPMRTIKTKWFEKTDDELGVSGVLNVVEAMAAWEVKERDRKFLQYCELAVKLSGQEIKDTGPLQHDHFRKIRLPALKNEIEPKVILLSKTAPTSFDLPDPVREAGMICIRSIDNDVLDSTEIWSFPSPKYLGYNLYYEKYKVCSKQERTNLWSFQGRETVGAAIGNINGITKLTLTLPRRLGFMSGEIKVPDDFDSMGDPEIKKMFVGSE